MALELAGMWDEMLVDLRHPDMVWQVLALVVCLVLAKLAERIVRGHAVAAQGEEHGRAWMLGQGGLKRVVFPLVALVLLFAARALFPKGMHVNLLNVALPLLGSLAVIRSVFYALRHSFSTATWLASFERIFALLVWCVVALHISGLLPGLIDALESVAFSVGKSKLNLWQLLQGVVTVLLTMLLALWVGSLVEAKLNRAAGIDDNLKVVLARVTKALLVVVAVLIGLPLVGLDLTTLSVFGGALGVGLGFGLQKIASNYVSGFIILLDRSISIGNIISVGADRGVVTRITTRYTVLKNLAGIEALVPNELLVGTVVQNESYSDPKVRIPITVQVAYDSDLEKAMAILVDVARAQPRVLADPAPVVLLTAFADSGINLELGFWIDDPEEGTGGVKSTINLAIWREFKAAGISIPFPQREVRILNGNNHV